MIHHTSDRVTDVQATSGRRLQHVKLSTIHSNMLAGQVDHPCTLSSGWCWSLFRTSWQFLSYIVLWRILLFIMLPHFIVACGNGAIKCPTLSQHLVPRDSESPAVPPNCAIWGGGREKNFRTSPQNLDQVSAAD